MRSHSPERCSDLTVGVWSAGLGLQVLPDSRPMLISTTSAETHIYALTTQCCLPSRGCEPTRPGGVWGLVSREGKKGVWRELNGDPFQNMFPSSPLEAGGVTCFGKRVFADIIRSLKVRSSWIIWVGLKSNDKCRNKK